MILIGVDPHKSSHTAVAVEGEVQASSAGGRADLVGEVGGGRVQGEIRTEGQGTLPGAGQRVDGDDRRGAGQAGDDEGTFSICSFWYVEALTRAGHLDEARVAFEKVLTYANHLGLYAEEISHTGEQLGNFP